MKAAGGGWKAGAAFGWSMAMSRVPPSAAVHPSHTFRPRLSPARVARRGVSSAVDWIRKAPRVAVVYSNPIACATGARFKPPSEIQAICIFLGY
jgi:hypothetical protein